jgi:hypothetical protein
VRRFEEELLLAPNGTPNKTEMALPTAAAAQQLCALCALPAPSSQLPSASSLQPSAFSLQLQLQLQQLQLAAPAPAHLSWRALLLELSELGAPLEGAGGSNKTKLLGSALFYLQVYYLLSAYGPVVWGAFAFW